MATGQTAIIFDFGNVVIRWDPYRALDHIFATRAEMEAVFEEIDFAGWNAAQDRGRPWDEGVAAGAAAHPAHAAVFAAYREGLAPAHDALVPGTTALINRLADRGAPLFGLTNAARETFEIVRNVAPVLKRLKGVVVSGEEGCVKPEAEIFHRCLARFRLTPEETVFVDDSEANCAAARAIGIDAIRFEDAPTLEADLIARRLL